MKMNELFLYYFMGCRGNFLATILIDSVTEVKFSNMDLKGVADDGYYKMHRLHGSLDHCKRVNEPHILFGHRVETYDDLFNAIKLSNKVAIRLLPYDADDLINSAHLALIKNHTPNYRPDELEGFCKHSYDSMFEDLEHRGRFDCVVYFRDLFNIDSIRQLYSQITGNTLDPKFEQYIIHNYSLQPQLTKQSNLSQELQDTIARIRSNYPGNFE